MFIGLPVSYEFATSNSIDRAIEKMHKLGAKLAKALEK